MFTGVPGFDPQTYSLSKTEDVGGLSNLATHFHLVSFLRCLN